MSEMKNECKELSSVNGYVSFSDSKPREWQKVIIKCADGTEMECEWVSGGFDATLDHTLGASWKPATHNTKDVFTLRMVQ